MCIVRLLFVPLVAVSMGGRFELIIFAVLVSSRVVDLIAHILSLPELNKLKLVI